MSPVSSKPLISPDEPGELALTGLTPRYLRSDTGTGRSTVDTEPLWWPPAKIVGRYLTPFLAAQLGLAPSLSEASRAGAVEVEIDPRDSASSGHRSEAIERAANSKNTPPPKRERVVRRTRAGVYAERTGRRPSLCRG